VPASPPVQWIPGLFFRS